MSTDSEIIATNSRTKFIAQLERIEAAFMLMNVKLFTRLQSKYPDSIGRPMSAPRDTFYGIEVLAVTRTFLDLTVEMAVIGVFGSTDEQQSLEDRIFNELDVVYSDLVKRS